MAHLKSRRSVPVLIALVLFVAFNPPQAADTIPPLCPLALHEESLELQEAELQLRFYRSSFAAFEEIYNLVADLWEGEAIDRMTYLKARYDMERAYLAYRRADCDQQAKAIEIAETNLAFNQQWLASILELRDQVSTLPDVIRAQLDVKLEEQKHDDAIRRTKACRAEMGETTSQGGT